MKVRKNTHRKRRTLGFSLLELLAVVTILGIIAVVVIPRISVSASAAKTNACAQTVAELNSSLERYYFDQGSYPASLSVLFTATGPTGQRYFPDGTPKNPFFTTTSAAHFTYSTTLGRVTGYKSS